MSDRSLSSNPTLALVIEDKPAVRAVVVETLEIEGFEVIEAPTADCAVTILRARDDIDVVFSDVAMPGHLKGFDLAPGPQTAGAMQQNHRPRLRWPSILMQQIIMFRTLPVSIPMNDGISRLHPYT